MGRTSEHPVERTLRWMTENLHGAYNARHPKGHKEEGKPCVNSGTCILAFCYINALGKVLLRGGPPPRTPKRDFTRFHEFVQRCMADFVAESNARSFPPTPRRNNDGEEWLYKVYRCGFVHGYPRGVAWGRKRRLHAYWYDYRSTLTLNIDEVVRGFDRGIKAFRCIVAAEPDLHTQFTKYITAE